MPGGAGVERQHAWRVLLRQYGVRAVKERARGFALALVVVGGGAALATCVNGGGKAPAATEQQPPPPPTPSDPAVEPLVGLWQAFDGKGENSCAEGEQGPIRGSLTISEHGELVEVQGCAVPLVRTGPRAALQAPFECSVRGLVMRYTSLEALEQPVGRLKVTSERTMEAQISTGEFRSCKMKAEVLYKRDES